MCNIYNLPTEIFLLIVTKGVEDELDYGYGPCFRRMKTFASVLRNVCRRSRMLIDDPVQTSFWVARLLLEVGELADKSGRTSLAKDLATSQAHLLTSEGCDLAVTFRVVTPIYSEQEVEERLMLHALRMLAPYQSQIVQFSLEGYRTDAAIYLLEQITCHWKMTRRLLEIQFTPLENYGWGTISESLDHLNLTRLDMLGSRRPTWMSLPATMVHLANLHRLEIPGVAWLNGDLILPHTLRHLKLSYVEVETFSVLYQYLAHNNLMCNHLRSISVGPRLRVKDEGGTTAKARPTWKAEGPLIFPHLLKLLLYEAAEGQITTFIGFLFCPSLDFLSLHWLDSGPDLEVATINPSPALKNTRRTINGVRSMVNPRRPRFRPVRLWLSSVSYDDILLLLISSNTPYLEHLLMKTTSSVKGRHLNDGSILALPLDQRMSMPSLRTFECVVAWRHFMHFLTHLSAPNLFRMSIQIKDRSANETFQDYPPTDPLPSLEIMHYSVSDPFILLKLTRLEAFPNLQELRIDYADDLPEHTGWSDLSITKDSLISLCRALGPSIEGSVSFSKLRLLDIYCRCVRSIDEDPEGWKAVVQEPEIHALVDDLLTERMRSGALPLYKVEPVLSSDVMDWYTPKREEVVVRIRAISTPIDSIDKEELKFLLKRHTTLYTT
jgi:hypothetical protein